MQDKIFRSYDIRGKYPLEINEDTAYNIGLGYGSILQERYNQTACVVSHDNRISSPSLYNSLIKGLLETGINVIDYGLTTTPMNYFARYYNNLYGIMITASHNPKDENGFKFSFDHFANARGNMIIEFRDYIKNRRFLSGEGKLIKEDIKEEYLKYLKNNIHLGSIKLKVVFDPANGAVTSILEDVLKEFDIDYIIINGESDGTFPNHPADPSIESNLEQLKQAVILNHADIGFGFDGDGDRLGIIDNLGKKVSIEHYGILIAKKIIAESNNKNFLYDAKCSNVFRDEIKKMGGNPIICRTGSSYTQEMINREKLAFGIQYVGHIGFCDRFYSTESAMFSFLRLLEILSNDNKSLNDLVNDLPIYKNKEEIRIDTTDEKKLQIVEKVKMYCDKEGFYYQEIDGLRIEFNDGWAYVRASNTGPTLNLRTEAYTDKALESITNIFLELINSFNK